MSEREPREVVITGVRFSGEEMANLVFVLCVVIVLTTIALGTVAGIAFFVLQQMDVL